MKTQLKFYFLVYVSLLTGSIGFAQDTIPAFQLPHYFMVHSTATIKGSFDGNKDNTMLLFENEDAEIEADIITETTTFIQIKVPEIPPGIYHLFIDEMGSQHTMDVDTHIFDMALRVGKSHLHKREKTKLTIEILGTKGFTAPIRVSVKNRTPRVIVLDEGNDKTYTLVNDQNKESVVLEVPITGRKTGTFDIEVNGNDDKLISWDWEKMMRDMEKKMMQDIKNASKDTIKSKIVADNDIKNTADEVAKANKVSDNDDTTKHPNTTSSEPRSGEETGEPTKKKETCTCGITPYKKHKPGTTIYTLSDAMKNKEMAQVFYDLGVKFPKTDKDNFKGQNVVIAPGSAYATSYGDIVGGYANAVANAFGKPHPKGVPVPYNFNTNYIGAIAPASINRDAHNNMPKAYKSKGKNNAVARLGNHQITVKPAKNKWSYVIGVVGIKTSAVSSAIDPVVFDRKFMKDFDRGREDLEYLDDLWGKISDPVGAAMSKIRTDILKNVFGKNADISLSDVRAHASNTDTYVHAFASVKYSAYVNSKKGRISKKSYTKIKAKIIRKNLKTPKITPWSSEKKNGGIHSGKLLISDSDPLRVRVLINGGTYLKCEAKGNGFADSGVESKTAVFIIGFCENEDGSIKIKTVMDAGMFLLNIRGKEISKEETTKIINQFEAYKKKLDERVSGKINNAKTTDYIKNNVENDIRKMIAKWL